MENRQKQAFLQFAAHGPMNLYQLWNSIPKENRGPRSSYQKAVNFLLKEGFITIKESTRWYGDRSQKIYAVTFMGMMEYLATLFKETPRTPEQDKRWLTVKQVLKDCSLFNIHPLFKELETLEEWVFEKDLYECLMSVAYLLKTHPPHIPLKTKDGSGDLASILNEPLFPTHPLVSEAYSFGYTYLVLHFVYGLRRREGKEGPFIIPGLRNLAQETLGNLIKRLNDQVRSLEKLKEIYVVSSSSFA